MTLRAGVIAAGRGDRLRQADQTLKPLVRVGGRTLIERVLASIAEAGASEVVVIINEESTPGLSGRWSRVVGEADGVARVGVSALRAFCARLLERGRAIAGVRSTEWTAIGDRRRVAAAKDLRRLLSFCCPR